MREIFKDIEGYKNYSVSNFGNVYSKLRKKNLKPNVQKHKKPSDQYYRVCLRQDGQAKVIYIHVLVGEAFLGKRDDGLQYDHIDRNIHNNKTDNLRIVNKCEQQTNRGMFKNNKTGHKNISMFYNKVYDNNYFCITVKRNNKLVFKKCLNITKYSLDDAIKVRDDFLKSV